MGLVAGRAVKGFRAGSRGLRWADRPLRVKGLAVLALPLFMLLVAAGLFFGTAAEEGSAQASVTHTRVVEEEVDLVRTLVLDGETGVRGFLLTGDNAFLHPTEAARSQILPALATLASLVKDNKVERARVVRLRQLLRPGWQLSPAGAPPASDPAGRRYWLARQKASTDAIRAVLDSMTATEDSLLEARQASVERWRAWAEKGIGLALAAGVLGGVLSMAAFTRGVARRLQRLREDADSLRNNQPLGAVDTSGDELGVISRRLHEAVRRQRELVAELQAARRAAEVASDEKTRFLSRMSHELRTPLNAVLGFAQLLEMDAQPDQRASLGQIRRAGRHLLQLINEVLDISRIESGQLALSLEPVMVSDLISEALEMMAPTAAEHQVSLQGDGLAGCRRHVRADRQRCKQVLINLVSNAIKYNRPGGVVRLSCAEGDDAMLRVEVRDSGIGIPPEDLSRLFTPFDRLSASSDTEGTGIGLALSLRLAQAMGGRIEAASTVGQGSTFTLVLPLAAEPARAEGPVLLRVGPSRPEPLYQPGRLRLLLVEDNLANVRLLEEVLRRRPAWELLHAGHGSLGLDLAAANHPDLVLLDLHMPDMAGDEVLRRLKADPGTADIPVVVVSADATSGQVDRLLAAGAASYVTKPIDVEELLVLLDQTAGATPVAPD
jgi:signal transduction histidine kinase/ActR/RegA family two-component response regulator